MTENAEARPVASGGTEANTERVIKDIIDAEHENLSLGVVGRASTQSEEELLENPLRTAHKIKTRIQELEDLLAVRRKAALEKYERENGATLDALDSLRGDYKHAIDLALGRDQMEDGRLHLINKARTTRVVNTEKFRQAFPLEFDRLAQIPVTKAEALIGKIQLLPLCDVTQGPDQWEVEVMVKKGAKA